MKGFMRRRPCHGTSMPAGRPALRAQKPRLNLRGAVAQLECHSGSGISGQSPGVTGRSDEYRGPVRVVRRSQLVSGEATPEAATGAKEAPVEIGATR